MPDHPVVDREQWDQARAALLAKGRDEDGLDWPQQWVRRHDEYEAETEGHCG